MPIKLVLRPPKVPKRLALPQRPSLPPQAVKEAPAGPVPGGKVMQVMQAIRAAGAQGRSDAQLAKDTGIREQQIWKILATILHPTFKNRSSVRTEWIARSSKPDGCLQELRYFWVSVEEAKEA